MTQHRKKDYTGVEQSTFQQRHQVFGVLCSFSQFSGLWRSERGLKDEELDT